MKLRERDFTGTVSVEVTDREKEAGKLVREAAAEGFVLLKNDHNLLPIPAPRKLALYGGGAGNTIKGGTGSGDVNERESISIEQGLQNAGYEITTKHWLAAYETTYREARKRWSNTIERKMKEENLPFYQAYFQTPFAMPAGRIPVEREPGDDAEVAVYVLSRISGEGADRTATEGDYFLTAQEKCLLTRIAELYSKIILVLNTGGMVDLEFMEDIPKIQSVLWIGQAGQEGGNAFADIFSGRRIPSGKLTDTWARSLENYPAIRFASGEKRRVEYREGIYTGYRYFDTFQIPVRYCFGFGLSYTSFRIETAVISMEGKQKGTPYLIVKTRVKNTGSIYPGKEVVQVYISCPQNRLHKEFRRLAAFGKTRELRPGEVQCMELTVPLELLASYEEESASLILEKGRYGIWVGNSLENVRLMGCMYLEEETMVYSCERICSSEIPIRELIPDRLLVREREKEWHGEAIRRRLVELHPGRIFFDAPSMRFSESFQNASHRAKEMVSQLSEKELIAVTIGDLGGRKPGNNRCGREKCSRCSGRNYLCAL